MLRSSISHRAIHSLRCGPPRTRRAIVTLETIIWLPVLIILLLAVIEMGLILTGSMHVAAASRLGAKIAAEDAALSPGTNAATLAVAATVRTEVNEYLQNAGYGPNASTGVRIQHNIAGGSSQQDGTCPEETVPPLPPATAPNTRAVRVVVCVNAATVSPNVLATFGFDLTGCTLEVSTTFPYERLP